MYKCSILGLMQHVISKITKDVLYRRNYSVCINMET